jgi:hypothetical protein
VTTRTYDLLSVQIDYKQMIDTGALVAQQNNECDPPTESGGKHTIRLEILLFQQQGREVPLMRQVFEKRHEVYSAGTVSETLGLIATKDFDVIVLNMEETHEFVFLLSAILTFQATAVTYAMSDSHTATLLNLRDSSVSTEAYERPFIARKLRD